MEKWVTVLSEVIPAAPQDRLRAAIHATFGLLNSTPYTIRANRAAELAAAAMADLLVAMARAALVAAAVSDR